MFYNIFNLEKIKIFNKVKIKKIINNLKIYISNSKNCYNNTYFFYFSKIIKKNNIVIKLNRKFLIVNFENFVFNLNNVKISFKKKIKIKNKIIYNLCNCKFSFNTS